MDEEYSDQQKLGASSINSESTTAAPTIDDLTDQSKEAQEVRHLQGAIDKGDNKQMTTDDTGKAIKKINYEDQHGLNKFASENPDEYVNTHASNNWFEVVNQYQNNNLLHPKNDPDGAEANQGMLVLIKYREKITKELLEEVKTPARENEEVVRRKMYLDEMGHNTVSEIPEEKKSEFEDFTKNNINPVKGSAPGSTNPTSDIDVNMSGDGTEFAVKWLNDQFKSIYGNGQESGVVYDVNFYAQDFVPGKMFDLKGKLELDKGKDDDNYYGEKEDENESWRTHVVKDQDQIDLDNNEQDISATLMMRVNMSDDDWAMYLRHIPTDKQEVIDEVEARYKERQKLIEDKKNQLKSVDVMEAGTTNKMDKALSAMGAENAIYEEKLQTDVEPKRIRFQLLKSQLEALGDEATPEQKTALQAQVDKAYVDLKTAKTKVMTYANAAYYTQGAVVGVVTNKQQLGRMYKDKEAKEDKSKREDKMENPNYKNLKLTSDEYYHGFTEQIGFALHGLHKAHGDAFYTELPMMGKYVHRAYNFLKHLYNFSDRAFPFSEEERRAASDWEGVKQSKALSDNKSEGYKIEIKPEDAKKVLNTVLKAYLGQDLPTKVEGSESVLDIDKVAYLIKVRLIATKATIDQFYPLILKKQEDTTKLETET